MHNSQLQLKDLSEKNAKALASSVTKFLKAHGIELQHTKALDLTGTLCGFGNWQGLQAAIVKKEEEDASKPIIMSYDEFFDTFRPVKNKLDPHAPADGYGFETYGAEWEAVQAAHARDPGTVWTVVDGEGTAWLSEGLHYVNRAFYFITRKPAIAGRVYNIPYGHEVGDLAFEISVINPDTQESEIIDVRYGASAEEVLADASIDYTEEVEGVVEEGQSRVIIVKQVAH